MNNSIDAPRIVGIGEVLWDIFPNGRQLGGAPANFTFHAHYLGANATLVSRVGDDAPGRDILDQLDSWSVGRDYVSVDPDHATGTVTAEVDASGVPTYVIHENVAWDFLPETEVLDRLAGSVDAVCFGSLCQRSPVSRAAIRRFLDNTSPQCLRVCDINLRQQYYDDGLIRDLLSRAVVLKLNDDELPVVARVAGVSGSLDGQVAALGAKYGFRLIALTLGAKGSVLWTADGVSCHPGIHPPVVDSVGAGDAFTAAVVTGLLAGYDLDRINARANTLAAAVCGRPGATPTLDPNLLEGI